MAAVSEPDRDGMPARLADRSVCIGPARAAQSYLKIDTLVAAALGTGADAVHPGYGFLAEQPDFPQACVDAGLIFIGPTADQIRKMGDKLEARKMAANLGIPVIPGSESVSGLQEALSTAGKIGYPVLLKAAAGGGGRGMKIVNEPGDMKLVFDAASAEARTAFGDARIYIEHYIPNARHIEVQVLGDRFGNRIHLGERDCSIQRRYQKMVEEAPSTVLTSEFREDICKAAVAVADHIDLESASTVEFMLDMDTNRFYFLEMNTRIQVEHPVTEMITGMDLVQEQIRIAGGHPLQYSGENVRFSGHAIECRINAESPNDDFKPGPGRIALWDPPEGPGIRIDSHCFSGCFIPPYYDSLLAKAVTWGRDRPRAIERMKHVLDNFTVDGIETTIPFYKVLMKNKDFIDGNVNTRWIESVFLHEYKHAHKG